MQPTIAEKIQPPGMAWSTTYTKAPGYRLIMDTVPLTMQHKHHCTSNPVKFEQTIASGPACNNTEFHATLCCCNRNSS
jgi:hypothetical protein